MILYTAGVSTATEMSTSQAATTMSMTAPMTGTGVNEFIVSGSGQFSADRNDRQEIFQMLLLSAQQARPRPPGVRQV